MSNNLLESLWARVDTNIGARIKQISELLTQALSANTESVAARDTAVAAEQTATTAATNAASSEAAAKSAESSASSHAQSAQESATSSLSAAERAELAAEETIQQVEGDFATRNYVDQRVPITGTGSPEGKIAAPVGSTYTDTAATNGAIRWVKTSGTGTTGWRVEYGNTGIRDITSLIEGDTGSGVARIQRVGNTVMLAFNNIPTPGDGTYMSIPNFIPAGFRSAFNWQHLGVGKAASIDAAGPVRVGTNGDLYIYRSSSETRINGTVTYISDTPWPTTLPGTPA